MVLGLAWVVAAALYVPMLDHPFIWDDYVQITTNPAVRDGVPARRYFLDRNTTSTRDDYNTRIYRPLRNWAMRGLWRLGDLSPEHRSRVFHTTNLALYLFGGWLVFLIVGRLARDELAAAMGASLWLLLPVHGEDVLYASAFGDLLSMVFQLGGLVCVMRALDDPPRRRADVIASGLFFALGLLCKEMAVTSVLIVPAYVLSEKTEWRRDPIVRRRAIVLCALHALVAAAYLALRTALLQRVSQDDITSYTLFRAVTQLPRLILLNLKVALMPLGHTPDYGPALEGMWPALAAATSLALLAWLCLRRRSDGLRFGALVFVLGLSPVLQLAPMWTLMADRFLLVPSLGIALALGGILSLVEGRRRTMAMLCVGLLLFTSAAGLAIERTRFESDIAFWAYAVQTVDEGNLAHQNLGLDYLKQGDPDRALVQLRRAYQLGRREPKLLLYLASAFEGVKDYARAENAARGAVTFEPKEPAAWAQLSSVLRHRGDLAGAQAALDDAERHGIAKEALITERANLLRADPKRQEEALEVLRDITTRYPNRLIEWAELGEVALKLGKRDEAEAAAGRCGELTPCRALRAALAAPPK